MVKYSSLYLTAGNVLVDTEILHTWGCLIDLSIYCLALIAFHRDVVMCVWVLCGRPVLHFSEITTQLKHMNMMK